MEKQEQQRTVEMPSELKTALVIEVDNICEMVLRNHLSQLDYQVEVVNTEEEAVEFIQTKSYTLITTNLGRPDLTILGLILEIFDSEINQVTPLIICTANDDIEKEQVCFDFGVDKVLKKPIDLKILKESIEECLSLSKEERKQHRQQVMAKVSNSGLQRIMNKIKGIVV